MLRLITTLIDFPRRVHRDERGAISLLSVFGIFILTILLGQIMNMGRQIDDKLRMQNAADAAAYTGGVGIARGMNAIAFSNHVLCETFALTAYMREARDRNSDQFIQPILAAWQQAGQTFAQKSQTQKFQGLGQAIVNKVPIEQQMVTQFSGMAYHQSRITLPAFEYLLMGPDANPQSQNRTADPLGGFIPRFQRAVVQTTPYLSTTAANEIAQRYGANTQNLHRSQPLQALVWRTNVQVAGMSSEADPDTRTIPAVDPSPTGPDAGAQQSACYYCISRAVRSQLSHKYLNDWINVRQGVYFEWDGSNPARGATTAKMSNYINLFRIFSCGQLDKLLNEEYPNTNLPHVLREVWPELNPNASCPCRAPVLHPWTPCPTQSDGNPPDISWNITPEQENQIIERDYQFVSTAYWPQMTTMMPGLYQNPLHRGQRTYAVTFAQVEVYIPRARYACCPWATPVQSTCGGNGQPTYPCIRWISHYDNWPREWDLFNQNWTVRLVPATATSTPDILQTHPQTIVNGMLSGYQAPRLGVTADQLRMVNGH